MPIPSDYAERVYAGVLGKMIGVFLGRPIEGWTYQKIQEKFGEVTHYLNHHFNRPLIITDDDLSGTFAFLRALEDNNYPRDLSSEQVGEAWLNCIVEGRSILWWGGMGNSTEQTAYHRLKSGVSAPRSGSAELNTKLIAEQIGAQIFIDGWGMVAPGDPDLAFYLAGEAARVSHDGEAVYAAQALAVMESLAFVEDDLVRLLDAGVSYIPKESVIARLIQELRGVRERESDWRIAREWLEANYGYEKYGGNVHVVPNHGVIILSLLYGDDDFLKTLMIANTCGWDTDCNSGNVGCLMGIKKGLAGIDRAPHLREPLADRLFISTAEGSRCVTDAVTLSDEIVRAGYRLAGLKPSVRKEGSHYHFEYPSSVQGFVVENGLSSSPTNQLNPHTKSRSLMLKHQPQIDKPTRLYTRGFIPPEVPDIPDAPYSRNLGSGWNYTLMASPKFYPGQTATFALISDLACELRPFVRYYTPDDQMELVGGPITILAPGEPKHIEWQLPDPGGPLLDIGLEVLNGDGQTWLDSLRIEGEPSFRCFKPAGAEAMMMRRAWVNAIDRWDKRFPELFRLTQMEGLGCVSTGSRQWVNYSVKAEIIPYLGKRAGVGVRYQGLRRQYAVLLTQARKLQVVKILGDETVLAECGFEWQEGERYLLEVSCQGNGIKVMIGDVMLQAIDPDSSLNGGGVSLLIEEGWLSCDSVEIGPVKGSV